MKPLYSFRHVPSSERNPSKHFRKRHLKELFDGSLPVFVAAGISRAVVSIFDAFVDHNNTRGEIIITMLYALFIAHTIGYLLALYLPSSYILFHYWFRIGIENAGFAWKQTATLIVLGWLYSSYPVGWSFLAWFLSLCGVALIICLSTVVEYYFLKPLDEASRHLQVP